MIDDATKAALREHASYSHWTSIPMRFCDTDRLGHINNTAIAAYIESARYELLSDLFRRSGEADIEVTLAHMAIDFIHEIHFPGIVEVGAKVLAVGTKSITTGYGLFKGTTCCCATSISVNVFFDVTTRRSCQPPQNLRDILLDAMS